MAAPRKATARSAAWPARVAYLSSIDVSEPTGPGVNEREFVAELLRRPDLDAVAVIPAPRAHVPELDDPRVVRVRPWRRTPWAFLAHQLGLLRGFRDAAAGGAPDILIMRLNPFPFAQWWIARRGGIPYALKTLGGGIIPSAGSTGAYAGIVGLVLGWLNTALVGDLARRALVVDACTTILCERAARDLRLAPGQVLHVDNATNTRRFHLADRATCRRPLGIPADARVIGYVGGVPFERGGVEVIETVAALAAEDPAIHGVVVGPDPRLAELHALAARLGVTPRVRIEGAVPYDRVPLYLGALDLGLALDRPDRESQVGNSYQKVRQYLSCGVPVVTTPGGSLDLDTLGLGTVITERSAHLLTVCRRWLSLAGAERETFRARAHAYAHEHLSVAHALRTRLTRYAAVRDGHS